MYRYWGKARPAAEGGPQWHPLVYHSLDVAAVGKVLLELHPSWCKNFAEHLGIKEDIFTEWAVFFLALHDLGKFAEVFQSSLPELFRQLRQRDALCHMNERHDSLGFLIWEQRLGKMLQDQDWFGLGNSGNEWGHWQRVFSHWMQTVTGHHGQPPKRQGKNNLNLLLKNHFTDEDCHVAGLYMHRVADLLLKTTCQQSLRVSPRNLYKQILPTSWWLAGFAVLCDWIGSNQHYFHYIDEAMDLAVYWENHAFPRAREAVAASGVLPAKAASGRDPREPFRYITVPTPLQTLAANLPLADIPQLFILEDVTGAGKTEAAIMLVHRLMTEGRAEGAYMGLPTMATANAMYKRMAAVYRQLFADKTSPSLVLAHSARRLSDAFRHSILDEQAPPDINYTTGEETATAQCTAWLADHRKKALLADIGVGTIDQALLGTLYSRHQSLRLLGLDRKVLIVDEVHACDAYMHRLLQTLLTFHAAAGGSAVLLSATLPQGMRQELVVAFCEGSGRPMPTLDKNDYPLLTHIGEGPDWEYPVDTRPEVQRTVQVRLMDDPQAIYDYVLQSAAQGRCVCWVRNSVADAIEAYEGLRNSPSPDDLLLFHARFAMGDRLAIENRVLSSFGKESKMEDRVGKVLIATQVVEQSLDLDFDVMISDLAPVDLLIQRAGRLCRHSRYVSGNPIENGPDQRGVPVFTIFAPQPVDAPDEQWFASMFPRAAGIYPDHGQLWLTARLLQKLGRIRMPDDARELIEEVYGEEAQEAIPEGLMERNYAALAEQMSNSALARQNSLCLEEGYVTPTLNWWDDTQTPTRLGEPVVTVRLARWEGDRLHPWCAEDRRFAWQLSEVSVRRSLLATEVEPDSQERKRAIEDAKACMPDRGKWSVLIPLDLTEDDVWTGSGRNEKGETVGILYHPARGLVIGAER